MIPRNARNCFRVFQSNSLLEGVANMRRCRWKKIISDSTISTRCVCTALNIVSTPGKYFHPSAVLPAPYVRSVVAGCLRNHAPKAVESAIKGSRGWATYAAAQVSTISQLCIFSSSRRRNGCETSACDVEKATKNWCIAPTYRS